MVTCLHRWWRGENQERGGGAAGGGGRLKLCQQLCDSLTHVKYFLLSLRLFQQAVFHCFWRTFFFVLFCFLKSLSLSQFPCLLNIIKQWSAAIPLLLSRPTYLSVFPSALPHTYSINKYMNRAEIDVYSEENCATLPLTLFLLWLNDVILSNTTVYSHFVFFTSICHYLSPSLYFTWIIIKSMNWSKLVLSFFLPSSQSIPWCNSLMPDAFLSLWL